MQVTVETISPLERKMTVVVEAARVQGEYQGRLNQTAKTVRVDGFRPGKVPMSLVQKRYGASVMQETVSELIRDVLFEAIAQEQLNLAGYPSVDEVKHVAGGDLNFSAIFEVYPEISLGDLNALSVVRLKAEISDADVDEMIETLRAQRVTWHEVDRAAALNDRVTIDFEGFVDGEAFEGGKAQAHALVLGSKSMIPGFEEALVGIKAAEDRRIAVEFPQDYQAEHLRGKAAEFQIHAEKVEESHKPELDEAFVRQFSEQGDVDTFRAEVRANMERELKAGLRQAVKKAVFDALVTAHEFAVPQALVSQEVQRQRSAMAQRFGMREVKLEMLSDELFKESAERSVSLGLLVSEIVRAQSIKVDEDKLRAMLSDIAAAYENPQQVIDWYLKDREQRAQIEAVVLEDQVVDWLLTQVTVADQASSYREVLQNARG